ncbi:hypothetical protein PFICI_14838 [Pestalotiopsis fici W106-1]|uniref:Uncharacterized protein n=1 Tax=Pestalotiopsis fici (strain W106-1 / CGMCC3.15140) TaxID=1229662 RepID=W3WH83_PESFW|nr:uncharacterized protein PFICI_14838 [Pestalotiopsis fici W106-1]ETS73233.1 hypothetical protein PFICI_14838 [Pestalotiopsis fici W106-1]
MPPTPNRRVRATPLKRKPEAQIIVPHPQGPEAQVEQRTLRSRTLLTEAEKACWHCIFRVIENYDPKVGTAPLSPTSCFCYLYFLLGLYQ